MTEVRRLLADNKAYASTHVNSGEPRPSRRLAVVTCMDARIDVAALGLHLGEAHVIRNAGGRVTDDVLRSLALASHVLGVDTVVIMQHTRLGGPLSAPRIIDRLRFAYGDERRDPAGSAREVFER